MGNGTSFEVAANMLKRKYPETFSGIQFGAFENTLEEYHGYLGRILNTFPLLSSQQEDPQDGGNIADDLTDEKFQEGKAGLISKVEEPFYSDGLSGLNEALKAAHAEAGISFQEYAFLPQHTAPVAQLIRLVGLANFANTNFAEIKAALKDISEDVSPEPEDAPDVEEEDAPEVEQINLKSISLDEKALRRSPTLKPEGAKWEPNLYLNLNYRNSAYLKNDDPRSFSKLISASEKDIFEFSSFFRELGQAALGYEIDEATREIKYSEQYTEEILGKINSTLDGFVKAIGGAYSSAKGREGQRTIESTRQSIADNLDRFITSIRYRDEKVFAILKDSVSNNEFLFGSHNIFLSNHFKNQDSEVFKTLKNLIYNIVFPDVLYMAYTGKQTFRREGIGRGEAEGEGWKGEYMTLFAEKYEKSINFKLSKFFHPNNRDLNLCRFLSSIDQERIRHDVTNIIQGKERDIWTYSDCAVCGKQIYVKKKVEKIAGGSIGKTDKGDYSEFKVTLYSLFREDKYGGGEITIDELTTDPSTGVEREYPAPEFFETSKRGGELISWGAPVYNNNFELGPKTWRQIRDMENSGNMLKHVEGALRKAKVLNIFHAKKLKKVDISDRRFKCPYKDQTGIKEELKSGKRPISDFNCGYSADIAPALTSGGSEALIQINPSSLRSGTSGSSKDSLLTGDNAEKILTSAVGNGTLSEESVSDIKEMLLARKSGGWKYSNTYFKCPTIINIEEDDDLPSLYKKYGYIVSPLAGPISDGSYSFGDEGFEYESSAVSPPSDGKGGLEKLEDGTISYMVCGTPTSLSSFDFITTKNFLESISSDFREEIVSSLINLGVEVSDLIPLLKRPEQITEAMFVTEDGRINKIARILSLAMASKEIRADDADILGEVILTCRHGHSFSINNSIHFGKTHCRFIPKLGAELRNFNSLLRTRGSENLKEAIARNLIFEVPQYSVLERAKYDSWRDQDNPAVEALMFSADDKDYYFSETSYLNRTFAWGKKKSKDLEDSVRSNSLKESRDIIRTRYGASDLKTALVVKSDGGDREFNSADRQTFKNSQSARASVSAFERILDRKDVIGNTVTELLSSSLKTCSNFLRLASSLEVRGSLAGTTLVELKDNEEDIDQHIKELIENLLSDLVQEGKLDKDYSGSEIADEIFDKVKNDEGSFISKMMKSNTKFLSFLESEFIEPLFKSIIRYTYVVLISKLDPKLEKLKIRKLSNKFFQDGRIKDELFSQFEDIKAKILISLSTDKKDAQKLRKHVLDSGGVKTLKIARMTGQEYFARIVYASTAFYIADQLSDIYNQYLLDSDFVSYIGFDIELDDDPLNLSTPEKIIELAAKTKYFNFYNFAEEIEDEFEKNTIVNIVECVNKLKDIPHGMETASSNSFYQRRALEYIKKELEIVIEQEEDSEDKTKAQNILRNIFTTVPITNIDLGSQSKYSDYFKPKTLDELAGDTSRSMMIPGFETKVIIPKKAKEASPKPIYALFDSKGYYEEFGLSISNEERLGIDRNMLCGLTKLDLSGKGLFAEAITADLPANLLESGYKAFFLPKKTFVIKDKSFSLIYHPFTEVSVDDNVMNVVNPSVNFDSSFGLNVGPQKEREGLALLFPPLSNCANESTVNNVGIPIPIENSSKKLVSADAIPIVGARIEILSGDFKLELSDLLQRRPVKDGANILINIIKIFNEYKRVSIEESADKAEVVRLSAKKNIEFLFKQYRGMPFKLVRRQNCRTNVSKTAHQVFSEDEQSSSTHYGTAPGYYIPFVDYVLMNKIITLECFSEEWAGHQVFSEGEANTDLIQAAQDFIIKSHGLEYLAEKLNKKFALSGPQRILPEHLLDPYKNLVLRRGDLKFSEFFSSEEFDPATGLRMEEVGSSPKMQDNSKVLFSKWAGAYGQFFQPHTEEESLDHETSYINVINTLFPIAKNANKIAEIQDRNSSTVMSADDIYQYFVNTLKSMPTSLELHSELKTTSTSSSTIGLNSISSAIKIYFLNKLQNAYSEQFESALKKKSTLFPQGGAIIKYSEDLDARNLSETIIMDEALRDLWRLTTGNKI